MFSVGSTRDYLSGMEPNQIRIERENENGASLRQSFIVSVVIDCD
jgi:hypothetical protein